ncbi:hypothetical protein PYJP_01790 [Pyrofollis japonicus]|uniref:hypothetical protein n=1 Tax=Pyrofollis japonicus TaxID=3060460 RepID=UPI00295C05D3|nr:hypothetical protein [Pyrofollis japonicus]BEP16827.1 hypothetical protein PYJP_01790 [Pyrofollis japonicus]
MEVGKALVYAEKASAILLGAYAAKALFPSYTIIWALLAIFAAVAGTVNTRMGLGVSILLAALASANQPSGLSVFLAAILVILGLDAAAETVASRGARASRACRGSCVAASIGSLVAVYGGIAVLSYMGSVFLLRAYNAFLEAAPPGVLAEFWRLASRSIAVRLIVYSGLLGIIYWVSSRLIAPLLQALAAPGYAVRRLLREEARAAKRRVLGMGEWYHRLLLRSAAGLVGFLVSPISYPIARLLLRALHAENAGTGIEAAMTAAVAWLFGILGYSATYSLAEKMLQNTIPWRKLVVAGAASLVALFLAAVLAASLSGHSAAMYAEQLLLSLATGKGSVPDPPQLEAIYLEVEKAEKLYRQTEELLEFLVKLFWS